MKPVFANSAFVSAPERFYLRGGGWRPVALRVRYGLFEHPTAGLALIDTGYGPRVTEGRRSLGLRLYNAILGPDLVKSGQPAAVLQRLGFTPDDVGIVIVTHFHADHVAGLDAFANARIIAKREMLERVVRAPIRNNLRHGIFTELLPTGLLSRTVDVDGFALIEAPLGLGKGRDLFGDGSVLAIDLPGHAAGHFGLCFTCMPRPLLYAVDAQWYGNALAQERCPGFPASLVADDPLALVESTCRVFAFQETGGEVLLCHDPAVSPHDLGEGMP